MDFEAQPVVDEGEADLDEAVGGGVGVLDGVGEEFAEEEFGDVGVAVAGGEGGEVRAEQVPREGVDSVRESRRAANVRGRWV